MRILYFFYQKKFNGRLSRDLYLLVFIYLYTLSKNMFYKLIERFKKVVYNKVFSTYLCGFYTSFSVHVVSIRV